MELIALTVIFFFVLDPFGNLPMVSSILSKFDSKAQRRIILRESIFALILLLFFLFLGEPVLNFLSLDASTLSISGGFILLLMALGMLFPSKSVLSGPDDEQDEDPFIVPIAIPLIAGPSSLTYVMLLAKQHSDSMTSVGLAVFAAWALSCVILLMSPVLMKYLGNKGMRTMERLMGMILILISTQMLLDGFAEYFSLGK